MTGDNKESSKSGSGGESTIPPDSDLILKLSDLLPGDVLLYRHSVTAPVGPVADEPVSPAQSVGDRKYIASVHLVRANYR